MVERGPPFIRAFIAMWAPGDLLSSFATGVGHAKDEQPLPFMREAHVRRAEESDLTRETKASQVCQDAISPEREMAADILEEDGPGPALNDPAPDDRPEMAGVGRAPPLAGEAEGLTWIACNDEIHRATEASARKGSGICPHRAVSQDARLHLRHQYSAGECFPLHVHDSASAWNCQLDGPVKSAASAGDGENPEGR